MEKNEKTDDENSDDEFNLNQLFQGDLPPDKMCLTENYINAVEDAEESQKRETSSQFERTALQISSNFPKDASLHVASDSDIKDYKDVVNLLQSKVKQGDQFFLTMRRNAPLSRVLSLWKRQASKMDPLHKLMVYYSGEDGIDSGAISAEFLEESIQEMRRVMFPHGSPIDSSLHVQNGDFRACGQLVALSLAQGGRPCFLEKCAYEAMFTNVDTMDISDEHLTTREVSLLEELRHSDCQEYSDMIIDHGYTGTISNKHVEEIIRSLEVSFVSCRCLYMKEFIIGAESYGLDKIIKNHPSVCKPLFVDGELKNGLRPSAD